MVADVGLGVIAPELVDGCAEAGVGDDDGSCCDSGVGVGDIDGCGVGPPAPVPLQPD